MNKKTKQIIASATVHLPALGGQGVLVPGGYILTAAHCINWSIEGGMALDDHYHEKVITQNGKTLTASIYAVEPCSDIAVLGRPDEQVFFDEAEEFESFAENTTPVSICADDFESGKYFPIQILTHEGKWVRGKAARFGLTVFGILVVKPQEFIEGGTSGGPIVDDSGQLVALTSVFGSSPALEGTEEAVRSYSMQSPRPHLSLPAWIWNQIRNAMADDQA